MASEVMKVALSSGITDAEKVLLTVASGHTYTVLNVYQSVKLLELQRLSIFILTTMQAEQIMKFILIKH